MKICINLNKHTYPLYLEEQLLGKVGRYVEQTLHPKRVLCISDENVFPLYGKSLKDSFTSADFHALILPAGEETKSLSTLPLVYGKLAEAGLTRTDAVLALGGGVIGDLAGFCASTYLRGIPFVQIPTTLLAQVDSSIGGKTALNLPVGKNAVGTFSQPDLICIDPALLKTLPEAQLRCGLGEIIKYACIQQEQTLFPLLQAHENFSSLASVLSTVVECCIRYKKNLIEKDPFDRKERILLNFGHTIGHAIEQATGYKKINHGEAVAIGMYQITCLSEACGLTNPGCSERLSALLRQYGLATQSGLSSDILLAPIRQDKKQLHEQLHLVLLRQIGEPYIYQTDLSFFPMGREM